MPLGNSVGVLALSRLARLTGETHWQEAADLQLFWMAVTAQEPPQDLVAFLRKAPHPELTALVKTLKSADELAALAPFTKGYPIPARGVRYYLCQGGACAQPTDSISELDTLLANNA